VNHCNKNNYIIIIKYNKITIVMKQWNSATLLEDYYNKIIYSNNLRKF